jgi:hypothetical protein
MNQKGYISMLFIIIAVLAASLAVGGFYVNLHRSRHGNSVNVVAAGIQVSSKLSPSTASTSNPTPSTAQNDAILEVAAILTSPDAYAGKRISVRGRIVAHTYYGAMPCPTQQLCSSQLRPPTLALRDVASATSKTLDVRTDLDLYVSSGGKPRALECKIIVATDSYDCSPYHEGSLATFTGMLTKDKEPIAWVGSSGATPPRVLKYRDIYYLVKD